MFIASQLMNGFAASALLLMYSLGVVMIMGHMSVVNMAHGECIMLGAYVCYYLYTVLRVPYLISLVMSFLMTALFGAAVERLIIRKLYGRTAETLLATYALSLIIKQLVNLICGSELKYVAVPFDGNISLFGVTVPLYNIFIIIITAAVLLITWIIFYKTPFGMEMRAATGNRSMAECLGINCRAVDTLTFAYGVGLAGLAGAVLAPIRGVSPFMGASYVTDSFMNVCVGGLQSLPGTALSSLLIGQSTSLLGGVWNEVNAKMLVFLIVVVIIRFRPDGLFRKERR